jgi:LacI family transcriptional regulator
MASIKDVAKKAGVGIGTVSRFLNEPDKVSLKTRHKVDKAIKELGYIRNEVARNLKMSHTRNVAFIVPSIWHPFFSGLAYFIEDALDKRGYKLMLCNSDGHPEKEIYYFDMLKEAKVSGILSISYSDIDHYIHQNIPMVSFDRHFTNDVSVVASDNYQGGVLAADLLIDQKKTHLAYVGTFNPRIDIEVKYRKTGFLEQAQKRHIQCETYVVEDPILDYESYLETFFDLYQNKVDGIFVENDNLAMSLIQHAKKRGIQIPEDLAVIGYDGVQENVYFEPSLTTIEQPLKEMAEASVSLLIDIIEKGPKRERIIVPVKIKKGRSA